MFQTRCKRKETDYAVFRSWYTTDKKFRVCQVRSKLGLPSRWLAIRCGQNESVISRHRVRARAEDSIRREAKGVCGA